MTAADVPVAPAGRAAGAAPAGPTAGAASGNPHFDYLLRLADDRIILGHRLSEWCGHAPILEEDIALANFALDFIGQGSALLRLAGETEGKGRTEDDLAFLRDAIEYRNVHLVELPNGDFAQTIVRQFLFDAHDVLLLAALRGSSDATLAGIAARAWKEAVYHQRHSGGWVIKLGDGTIESHNRAQSALDELWPFSDELFSADEVDLSVALDGFGVDHSTLRTGWRDLVTATLGAATLTIPSTPPRVTGGRTGRHSEHLGHLLTEMQILPRSHPGAEW
ncbi:MAG: 1,2-phenylacetyl-CoA epoxidase subunit PaaC [Gemmatimonadota bacterium]